jgi:hypothetical protein
VIGVASADPNKFSASREDLIGLCRECEEKNPLLARIRGQLVSLGWTEEEILRYQLLICVTSNASIQAHASELERHIASIRH